MQEPYGKWLATCSIVVARLLCAELSPAHGAGPFADAHGVRKLGGLARLHVASSVAEEGMLQGFVSEHRVAGDSVHDRAAASVWAEERGQARYRGPATTSRPR